MSNTVTDIAVLEAFDFSDCPGVSFGEAHQTPWRTDIPYPDGLRRALVHFQEIESDLPHADWRHGMYRFQIDLVQRGYLQSFHLETGRAITTRCSLPAHGDTVLNPVFYRFDDPEEHYLIVGFHPPRLVGFYFPKRKQVVSIMNHAHPVLQMGWKPARLAMSCQMLEELMLGREPAVAAYSAGETDHRLVLTQSFHPNAGHQLREEFPMLWKLFNENESAATLLTGPFDILGLSQQLPLAVAREAISLDESEAPWAVTFFDAVLERGLLIGRMGCTSHMPEAMQAALQEGFRRRHPAEHAQMRAQLRDRWPVVWLTLRQHNRKWVDEGANLGRLAEAVTEKFPRAAFVLDGMGDVRGSADEILETSAHIVDAVGSSFTEALACFSLCDSYVMPYSNSCALHMVDPRPGVVHGLKGWIPDEPFEPAITENKVLARVVHGEKHPSGDRDYDAWVTTCDYDLSGDLLLATLLEVLAELPPRDSTK